jgi:DsbC/DsbD-like thiol-disulfide interchange protein
VDAAACRHSRSRRSLNGWTFLAAIAAALSMLAVPPLMARASDSKTPPAAIGQNPETAYSKADGVVLGAGSLQARVRLSADHARSGQELAVAVDFDIAPGWHVYGKPLPRDYTPLSVRFGGALVASQSMIFPKPALVKFEGSGETLPVYHGRFTVDGKIRLSSGLDPGRHRLKGTLAFQECSEVLCKMPQTLRFDLPITITAAATRPK